ncbi:protein kinase [Nonomuraea sp. NPDC050663]|uniref:serine/threonine protein kinase n=1 Tax=Nonomuraea sp. NPDC050663 TaxID=3364370 RepID=UPI0037A3C616
MSLVSDLRADDPQRIGAYELRGRLGQGGQGVVYLGADPSGQLVALKWLHPHLTDDAVAAERFAREVAVAQRVAPFCTAKVITTGVHNDRPYIASEYVEGLSLAAVVRAEGPRTGASLSRLAIGTATALAAIHQAGIVHRDFSPGNVLLASDGPRVIDFGIARALEGTSTITSTPMGTPAFMAPEQIMGAMVSPAADMFSWGSTIAFASSGTAPFFADSVPAVINRVLNAQPDLSAIEGDLRDLVAACLAKDPAARPTAQQVIMRLLHSPGAALPDAPVGAPAGPASWSPPGPPHVSGPQQPPAGYGQQPPYGQPPWGGAPPLYSTGPQQQYGNAPQYGAPAQAQNSGAQFGGQQGSGAQFGGQQGSGAQFGGQQGNPAHYSGPQGGGAFAGGGPQQPPGGTGDIFGMGGQPYGTPAQPWQQPATAPQEQKKRPWLIAVIAATVALVATVAAVIFVVNNTGESGKQNVAATSPAPSDPAATSAPPATPDPTPTPTESPQPTATGVPKTDLAKVVLPDAKASVFSHPDDPITLLGFSYKKTKNGDWVDYVKTSGSFRAYNNYLAARMSPNGKYTALRTTKYTSDNWDTVELRDNSTGRTTSIRTVKSPQQAYVESWSLDSTRILINVGKYVGDDFHSSGFAIIDVSQPDAPVRPRVIKGLHKETNFGFDHRQQGVIGITNTVSKQMLRFYSPDGKLAKTVKNVGEGEAEVLFSPSGEKFVTDCPGGNNNSHCIFSTASGAEVTRFASACTFQSGWYDEEHLTCWSDTDFRVIDFEGNKVRELARFSEAVGDRLNLYYSRKAGS